MPGLSCAGNPNYREVKMVNTKAYEVVFVSAFEYPVKTSLVYSQLIRQALYFKNRDVFKEVHYLGIVSTVSKIKGILLRKPYNLDYIYQLGLKSKIIFAFMFMATFRLGLDKLVFVPKSKIINYICKKIFINWKELKEKKVIFICRSYIATHAAIALRERMKHKSEIRIVFDMRSIFSNELPFFKKSYKRVLSLYGYAKTWEDYLISKSDITIITTSRAKEYLELENPQRNIKKINIQGLGKKNILNVEAVFKKRWTNKKIAYVGTVGHWNSTDVLDKVFEKIHELIPEAHLEVASQNYRGKYPCHVIDHHEIDNYYEGLLAIIVPGMLPMNYFENSKISYNFFSTKVAEALSRGVPIISNKIILELYELIKEKQCGILFGVGENGKIDIDSSAGLNNQNYWREITNNAMMLRQEYFAENIFEEYIKTAIDICEGIWAN